MSWAAQRRADGAVATTLARVEGWLLEPAAPAPAVEPVAAPAPPPVVGVVSLAPRCGATAVARGLAATFAARAALGAAIVCGPSGSVALKLSTSAAARLGRAVADHADGPCRVSGRLCLVDGDPRLARAAALRHRAALVVDAPHGADPSDAAALADVVVLVAARDSQPALVALVAESLARPGTPDPLVVIGRPGDGDPWAGPPAALELPDARLASRIALAGREPPGVLGARLAELAARCEERAR